MTTSKVQWLQLPDGTYVGIENGDAEATGRYILQHYVGQHSHGGSSEEPLPLPPPMFGAASDAPAPSALVGNDEVLEIPKMEFGAPLQAPARSAFVENDEPLELPKMIF